MTKYSKIWDGSRRDLNIMINHTLGSIDDVCPGLDKESARAILCAALHKVEVQKKIQEWSLLIWNNSPSEDD